MEKLQAAPSGVVASPPTGGTPGLGSKTYHYSECRSCGTFEATYGGTECPCGGTFVCDEPQCDEPRCYLA